MPEPKAHDRTHWHSAGNTQEAAFLQPRPGRPVAIDHVRSLVRSIDARDSSEALAAAFLRTGVERHRPPSVRWASCSVTEAPPSAAVMAAASPPSPPPITVTSFTSPYHTVWYGPSMPTRSDWIQAGLAAVADDGPNGLRIDRLCRRLGVSKGSFHHHFAGAGDFKRALLAAYEALVVEALDQAIEQTAADNPKAALAGLTAAITSTDRLLPARTGGGDARLGILRPRSTRRPGAG